MRACPQCGQEVAFGHGRCTSCGAEFPPGRPVRGYILSAVSLIAIIVAAVLLHSYLRQRVVRTPMDFVPSSAVTVMDLDLRPEGPAMLLLREKWSGDDISQLGRRATELAQGSVSLLGLDLDLRGDVSRWFGNEAALASIPQGDSPPLSARSLVLIVRVTDLRRARRDLDEAVAELARQHDWERVSRRSGGRSIIFWGRSGDRSEIAYCASEGCVVIGADADVVDLCLQAGRSSTARLTDTADFRETRGQLPGNAFLWGYSQTGELLHAASSLVPAIHEGWLGLAKAYLRRDRIGYPRNSAPSAAGSAAFAMFPESDGLRVHAGYRIEPRGDLVSRAETDADIIYFAPPGASVVLLVHRLPALVQLLSSGNSAPHAAWNLPQLVPVRMLLGLLASEQVPDSLLLTVTPREEGGGGSVIAGAFAGAGASQAAARLAHLLPGGTSSDLGEFALFASKEEGLRQLNEAAELPRKRYKLTPDVRLFGGLRPATARSEWGWLEYVELTLRDDAKGGQAELYLRGEPRHLLGD